MTDITLTVGEECSAAYGAGWLEMECKGDVALSSEELLVTDNVKDFIETVSTGSLLIPHRCTYAIVRCGLSVMENVCHRACCRRRLFEIPLTLASFGMVDTDCDKMFHHPANVLLYGIHSLEEDQQKNAVLPQTSVKKARMAD